ncbi:unnamed protein product [Closterium sp. NIES-65]|nr:unnamed protein product [Closterium sp. NIES-65]
MSPFNETSDDSPIEFPIESFCDSTTAATTASGSTIMPALPPLLAGPSGFTPAMRLLGGSDPSGLNWSSEDFFGRLGGSCLVQNPNAPRKEPEKRMGKVAGKAANHNASREINSGTAVPGAPTNLKSPRKGGALKDGQPVQSAPSLAALTTPATTRATRAAAATDRRRRAVSVGGDLDGDLGRAVACDVAMSPLFRLGAATTTNRPSTCRVPTSSSHTSATRTTVYYSHATMSRDTTSRSGGASPAAAISPPPSSSFPATSVFLPALLRLGVDLSDDPDDREQVVAQGLAHDQAKAAQGRRHRRTGSLDTMLLAKPGVASGKGVSSVKSIGDGSTTTTRRTTGNSGTITARSAAAIEAGSMAGGSKKDDAIPVEATSFSATSVSEERDTSSSSSSSSRRDPTGFKSFQSVPTTAQPAAGSPKPVVFGSARFSESSGLKGFKPAFLRLGDDLGDDPDDWDWLAGGQHQTWSNPGGPLRRDACRDDDSSVAPAGPFGCLAPAIAAPTTTAAAATVPALPPPSLTPVAGPVAGSSSGHYEGQQQRQGQGQQRRRQQQRRRTHSCDGSLQHAMAPLFEARQKSFLQHPTAPSVTFSGTAGSETLGAPEVSFLGSFGQGRVEQG